MFLPPESGKNFKRKLGNWSLLLQIVLALEKSWSRLNARAGCRARKKQCSWAGCSRSFEFPPSVKLRSFPLSEFRVCPVTITEINSLSGAAERSNLVDLNCGSPHQFPFKKLNAGRVHGYGGTASPVECSAEFSRPKGRKMKFSSGGELQSNTLVWASYAKLKQI